MRTDSLVLGASFLTILGGLGILLGSEAIGAAEMWVVVGGGVTLVGVAVLTATIMRVPHPDGAEH
ncbi:hypothetical protein ACFQJC_07950 [Haloferax namakaokahaiae]|uniref:DUF2964 family protein n=1 Tax=Haloferax namakaokahaiae TaxID=1748331 RepID=A0ABD5ZE62_9EURY